MCIVCTLCFVVLSVRCVVCGVRARGSMCTCLSASECEIECECERVRD
jgi:hypothetical protein